MSPQAWKHSRTVEAEEQRLAAHGYDGLFHPEQPCGCWIGDLYPCGERPAECQPGHTRNGENGVGVYGKAKP